MILFMYILANKFESRSFTYIGINFKVNDHSNKVGNSNVSEFIFDIEKLTCILG